MDKDQFLRLQYLRMINSDEFVVERWRSNMDIFIRDMWDRTPARTARRFLSPVDRELGYSPDNVEWQFPRSKPRRAAKGKAKTTPTKPVVDHPTKEERKEAKRAAMLAEREAKQQAIAAQLVAWNQGQLVRQG